jgi:hypothetical protein
MGFALCGIPSEAVGYDPIRAVDRHLNPEQAHPAVFRKSRELDEFAVCQLNGRSARRIHALPRTITSRTMLRTSRKA